MREFLKNKFFVAAVIIACLLIIIPSTLSILGISLPVRNVLNIIMTPLQKAFDYMTDAIDGYASYFTEFDDLVEENAQLKSQLNELSDRLHNAEEIEVLNAWLVSFLEMKRAHTDFHFEAAAITGRESGNYMTVFTVDRGTAHGITEGMPVVTPEGVLGYVDEVGLTWAKVRTLIESSSAVGVCIERTGELGLLEGNLSLSAEGLCRITYLSADSTVTPGDCVITSGYGSVYPRGLTVGYITEVVPDEFSRTLTAYVRPATPLTDLDRVMIITSYDIILE